MNEGLVLKSARVIPPVLDLMVGLDGDLVEELLSSSVSDLLPLLKWVPRFESDWGGGLEVSFKLVVQSLLWLLTGRTRSLEETTL